MNAIESGRNEWKYYSRGPLNEVAGAVKCNYVIYWSGDHGMNLVDKWTTEGKINEDNKEVVKTYWDRFDEYVHPSNQQADCSSRTQVAIPRYYEFRGLSH